MLSVHIAQASNDTRYFVTFMIVQDGEKCTSYERRVVYLSSNRIKPYSMMERLTGRQIKYLHWTTAGNTATLVERD